MILSNILSFSNFYNQIRSTSLPFKTAHKLSKLSKAIEEEIGFYREKMTELIEQYAQKDNDGNYVYINDGRDIAIVPEKIQECQTKIHELETMDIELPNITFSVEEFENTTLTVDELQPILPFIED
jgi:hypothetical protein